MFLHMDWHQTHDWPLEDQYTCVLPDTSLERPIGTMPLHSPCSECYLLDKLDHRSTVRRQHSQPDQNNHNNNSMNLYSAY